MDGAPGGSGSIVGDGPDAVLVPLASYLETASLRWDRATRWSSTIRATADGRTLRTRPATFTGDVTDLEAVRAALGLGRFALVGFDYLAGVVTAYAAEHPARVSRLILLSPTEPTDSLARAWNPPERMARLDTTDARALVKMRAAGRDTSDAEAYCRAYWRVNAVVYVGDVSRAGLVHPDWCALPNETPARLAAQAALVFASLGPEANLAAAAARVTVPTLVIHGDRDLIASGRRPRLGPANSGARLWMVAGAGLALVEANDPWCGPWRRFSGTWPDGRAHSRPAHSSFPNLVYFSPVSLEERESWQAI